MASTNKTSNYNLSQYVGTDKPTYLGDYNSDMSKIDAQMKANSEATSVVAGQVETIGQTATTALQNANTAQSSADNASSIANNALEKSTANEASIANIEINYKGTILFENTSGGYTAGSIQLTDDVSNYEYLEVYYETEVGQIAKSSTKFYKFNNKQITFNNIETNAEGTVWILTAKWRAVSNTLIQDLSKYVRIASNNSISNDNNANAFKIERVVGYKSIQ